MNDNVKINTDQYGFGKLDTWFIDKYLRHEGETLEEAKQRIYAEKEEQKNVQNFSGRR